MNKVVKNLSKIPTNIVIGFIGVIGNGYRYTPNII